MEQTFQKLIAIGGRINQAKDRFGKDRMRDGQRVLDESLKIINAEIERLRAMVDDNKEEGK